MTSYNIATLQKAPTEKMSAALSTTTVFRSYSLRIIPARRSYDKTVIASDESHVPKNEINMIMIPILISNRLKILTYHFRRGGDALRISRKTNIVETHDTLNDLIVVKRYDMHHPGIEPRANAWKAFMLPLHQWCLCLK